MGKQMEGGDGKKENICIIIIIIIAVLIFDILPFFL